MASQEYNQGPQEPTIPPTAPLPYASQPPQSVWPKVFGIIVVVWASLGLLGGVCGTFSSMMGSAMSPATQPGASQPPTPLSPTLTAVGTIIGLGMAGLLLAGGIGLLQRRRWSVTVMRTWAVLQALFLLIWTPLTYGAVREAMEEAQRDAGGAPAAFPGMIETIAQVSFCFGIAFGLIPSLFVLWWFWRRPIREEVRQWM